MPNHNEYMRGYYASNAAYREYAIQKSRKWRRDNPDRLRKQVQDWRERNPEKHNLSNKKWRDAHPKQSNECTRSWERRNRTRARATKRRWYRNNRVACVEQLAANRAKRRGYFVAACSAKAALLRITSKFCRWCCTGLTDSNFSLDHIVAINAGGRHPPNNLAACCRRCNSSKGDKDISAWLPTVVQY